MTLAWHPSKPGHRIIVTGISGIDVREGAVDWAHVAHFITVKGKHKANCKCGWQGSKQSTYAEAKAEYDNHVGLAVRKGRR